LQKRLITTKSVQIAKPRSLLVSTTPLLLRTLWVRGGSACVSRQKPSARPKQS